MCMTPTGLRNDQRAPGPVEPYLGEGQHSEAGIAQGGSHSAACLTAADRAQEDLAGIRVLLEGEQNLLGGRTLVPEVHGEGPCPLTEGGHGDQDPLLGEGPAYAVLEEGDRALGV